MHPDPERRRNRGFLGSNSSALSPQDRQDRRQLRYELDLNSWNLRIWGVAASGFLTDSYNLFASNVILASVAFVYFPDPKYSYVGTLINVFTLLGSVVGQLTFGFLADYYGRTRLYGIELILVIVSTIGVATSNYGYHNDLSFLGLFIWWRFVMGIGIGAEYPLSAVITAEWASTSSRATMLSSVFLMQPVGQALAQLVGVWVVLGRERLFHLQEMQCGINTKYAEECREAVDGIWRIVIGSGAVPALLAIIFRFFLYDCGLYSLEVKNKPGTAFRDTQRIYGAPMSMSAHAAGGGGGGVGGGGGGDSNYGGAVSLYSPGGADSDEPMPVQFSIKDLRNYFVRDGNWCYLLGTAATWFFLDVSFYGFSLDNRGVLADLWVTKDASALGPALTCWNSSLPDGNSTLPQWQAQGQLPIWQTDASIPCNTIYDVLIQQAKQYLLTVSLASISGSACFIFAANRLRRRQWLTTSFIVLFFLFIVTGAVYYGVNHTSRAPATVVLVAICHFVFNFGANTLTFIIPAEIFPTCYRCTCHGISAAAGKTGSIVAVLIVYGVDAGYKSSTRQGLLFLLFGSFMACGAVYSWAYLPDIQRVVGPRRTAGRPGVGGVNGANGVNGINGVNGVGIGGVGGSGVRRVGSVGGVGGAGRAAAAGNFKRHLETKNLEDLGEGRAKARLEGEILTVRGKCGEFRRRRGRRRLSSISAAP
ncbi:Major facilitator superfamily domain, general substrate transporter [Niveomyces insectorum RCEF 264]|uniref:Major facilitator superfamily domain, general substrate transporter n=1 Tax=Niveomyces insectorum RCEF 264 TaxID=1081102 RepID=A0A167M0D1_9HYPO|nr:Major facilitator superfamily domain, general substrate transporter [Niveomyces insectorum RCEF 264]